MSDTPRHRLFLPLVAGYAAAMFAWCSFRHAHFGSNAYDLGAYQSVFWNFAHRGILWNSVERSHQYSNHLELGLAWLWLPNRFLPSVTWLFALQSISCAAAALPVEALARRATGDPLQALLCAAAMLVSPQLLGAQNFDFHSITVCAFPMALLVYGIERDRAVIVALATAVALSLREQMGLAVAGAAVAWLVRHGRARALHAALLGSAGVAAFLIEVLWVIPSFADAQVFRYVQQYGRLGRKPAAALDFALSHPIRFLLLPFEWPRPLYLLELASGMLPALVLSLRAPRRAAWPLLLAAPLLAVQLYNDRSEIWSINFQYGAPVVPLFAAAVAFSLGELDARTRHGRWMAVTMLFATLVHAGIRFDDDLYGPGRPIDPAFSGSPRAAALRRALEAIPAAASISASNHVVPHVANREHVHRWPDGETTDEFVLLDSLDPMLESSTREPLVAASRRLRNDSRFEIVVDEAGVLLVERRR